MSGKDNLKIIIKKLGNKLHIDVNVVVSERKLVRCMLFTGLVIVLIILATQGEQSINWRELLIGLIQSIIVDYLNHK